MISFDLPACILLLSFLVQAQGEDGPIVKLPYGTIRGLDDKTPNGKSYHVFLKVPYAAPPTGSRRFKPPEAPLPWEGVRNTTVYDTICYQGGSNSPAESEDCLFLNVYTPSLPCECKNPLPVMFFIHGGGFVGGSVPKNIYGPDFIIDEDVILVACNYRLGLFGFLSTLDETIPGNYGLLDQQFAMRWTKKYISLFGGDPNKVTIFGQSAGAASVAFQLLLRPSNGLYRAAIIESGSAIDPWAIQRNAREIAFATASYVNDSFTTNRNTGDLLDFYMKTDAKTLDNVSGQYALRNYVLASEEITQGFVWAPVKHDHSIITENMYVSYKKGHFNKVPVIMGITSEELIFVASIPPLLQSLAVAYDQRPELLVPDDMGFQDANQKIAMGLEIREIYTGGAPFAQNLGPFVRFLSDAAITKGLIRQGELQALHRRVKAYFYQFSYRGLMGGIPVELEDAEDVSHTEELRYIFRLVVPGYDNANKTAFPQEDFDMQELMVKTWTDFAKTANPTPAKSSHKIAWPPINFQGASNYLYMNFNKTSTIENHPKNRTYPHWVDKYKTAPNYDNFDTY